MSEGRDSLLKDSSNLDETMGPLEGSEAGKSRLIYDRTIDGGRNPSSVASGMGTIVSRMDDDDQGLATSAYLDGDSNAEMSVQNSSDLCEVMDIMGGCEAEKFLKEVSMRNGDLDRNADVAELQKNKEDGLLDVVMDSKESIKWGEVSKLIDNPAYEPNNIQFTFCNVGCIEDLKKVSSVWKIMENERKVDSIKPLFDFSLVKEINQIGQLKGGGKGVVNCCGSSMKTQCSSGDREFASSDNDLIQQRFKAPVKACPVKKEIDKIGTTSNAWKKSSAVQLSLLNEIGSFMREDGLVNLYLNKARNNV